MRYTLLLMLLVSSCSTAKYSTENSPMPERDIANADEKFVSPQKISIKFMDETNIISLHSFKTVNGRDRFKPFFSRTCTYRSGSVDVDLQSGEWSDNTFTINIPGYEVKRGSKKCGYVAGQGEEHSIVLEMRLKELPEGIEESGGYYINPERLKKCNNKFVARKKIEGANTYLELACLKN